MLDIGTKCPGRAGSAFKAAVPRPLIFKFVLELWSGTGRFSSAMTKLSYTCILSDIRCDSAHDITQHELHNIILGWSRLVHAQYAWMGVLCKSWSRARNMPGGPCIL